MDNLVGFFSALLGALVVLLILFFIIKGAVRAGTLEAMKEHTRWVASGQDDAKKP